MPELDPYRSRRLPDQPVVIRQRRLADMVKPPAGGRRGINMKGNQVGSRRLEIAHLVDLLAATHRHGTFEVLVRP
jgi:hypothetical protein